VMTGNGTQPDPSWPLPNGADFVAIGLSEDNCRANNTFVSDLTFGIFALECQLPVPEDAFQGCPVSLPPPAI